MLPWMNRYKENTYKSCDPTLVLNQLLYWRLCLKTPSSALHFFFENPSSKHICQSNWKVSKKKFMFQVEKFLSIQRSLKKFYNCGKNNSDNFFSTWFNISPNSNQLWHLWERKKKQEKVSFKLSYFINP